MLKLAGDIRAGQKKSLPAWNEFLGLVTMAKDGTVVFYMRRSTEQGDAIFQSVFPPGSATAAQYAEHVGGLLPNETKPVPPWPETVGVAKMSADGTLTLYLRSESNGGPIAETVISYKPGDQKYDETIAHIGGIRAGEEKPIPPWN